MKLPFGGLPTARISGFVCLSVLLATGCGTVIPHSTTGSGSTSAAATTISTGAQLGLVWSTADSTLRPLSGVPGSSQLGAALFPAGSYVSASFSAQTQTALLIDPKGNLQWMALPTLTPQTIAQGIPSGASIAFSPKGACAVVFAPGTPALLTITGLPQQPVVTAVTADNPVLSAAISDAASLLLATSAGNNSIAVTETTTGGTRTTVAALAGFGGMAFVPGSEDILLSDSVANTLSRFHNGSATVLATHANGLNQPFAVAASLDDHWAVSADRADTNLLRIDLTGATAPAPATCSCTPNQLSALNGNAVFEVTSPGTAPGWMIEADDPVSRVLFIPPARGGK
ncbi:MAG: hypothetical protein WA414_12685 [Acidobacteriaceae bacterium]